MTPRTGQLELDMGTDRAIERAEQWARKARGLIDDLYAGQRFTADDIRLNAGDPPGHGDALGSVLTNARRAGLIRAVDYTVSERPERHRAVIRIWERTEVVA